MIDVTINNTWTIKMPEHRQAQWAHPWEVEHLASMYARLLLGGPKLIIDVGAEEGDMPALFASWGHDLILVEPGASVWPNMRATFEANNLRAPLLSFAGFAGAEIRDADVWAGWPPASDGPITTEHSFGCLAQHAHIPVATLDHLTSFTDILGGRKVGGITIDVEGSELDVLRGAVRILLQDHPLVWVSIHKDLQWMAENYPDGGRAEVFAFMESLGYLGTTLADEHEEHALFEWVGA